MRCHHEPGTDAGDLAISPEKAALAAHGQEVALVAAEIGAELGLPPEALDHLRLAAMFHDIGKLWVPNRILEKDGPLTLAEWKEIRKHPEHGALMLRAYGLEQEAEWVLFHHERPDGLGYPYGLSGEAIPMQARILAIADAWSSMRTDRPYSAAATRAGARRELEYTRGEQFDAALVDIFLDRVEPRLAEVSAAGGARAR